MTSNTLLILIEKVMRWYIQTIASIIICVAYFRNLIGQNKSSFHVPLFIIGLFSTFIYSLILRLCGDSISAILTHFEVGFFRLFKL